jgi:hypothetical protein
MSRSENNVKIDGRSDWPGQPPPKSDESLLSAVKSSDPEVVA